MGWVDFDVLSRIPKMQVPQWASVTRLEGTRVTRFRCQGLHSALHIPPVLSKGASQLRAWADNVLGQ